MSGRWRRLATDTLRRTHEGGPAAGAAGRVEGWSVAEAGFARRWGDDGMFGCKKPQMM